jgi:simple sugar transport system permease protein
VTERSGVINLGIEGQMLAGALAAALGASAWGPWGGLAAGMVAGMIIAIAFAALAIGVRADQIIVGTAVTLAAVGLTGTIYRQAYGIEGAGLGIPTFSSLALPGLVRIPVLGPALFDQPVPTYLAFVGLPLVWWGLFRTRWGLALRATGEAGAMARAVGVKTGLIRTVATVVGGGFSGLGGATLVLAQVGTFTERMTSGRGFLAIAIVVLGRWHPIGVALAALLFGLATALQFLFQALGVQAPYQLFLMLPYLLTLLALAGAVGRVRAPGDLGR